MSFYQAEQLKEWNIFQTLKLSCFRNINNISEMGNKILNLNLGKRIDQHCWNHGILYFECFIITIKKLFIFHFMQKRFRCTFFCDIQ